MEYERRREPTSSRMNPHDNDVVERMPPGRVPPDGDGGQMAVLRKIGRGFAGLMGFVLVFLISVCLLILGLVHAITKGDLPSTQELFVVSVNETSAVKFLARIFYTEERVQEILAANAVLPPDEITDLDSIIFVPPPEIPKDPVEAQEHAEVYEEYKDIEIIDITGSTFKGKMMIVRDPSRVHLTAIPYFGYNVAGKKIESLVSDAGAIAGMNAGGFADDGGMGSGGMPLGLFILDGEIKVGAESTYCNVIGITYDHKLVVGEMTGADALALGVRDAVHFTPTLIVNGKAAEVSGSGGGVNPRTCIGQRADGAMLLLCIDGRQPHSIGASLQDCVQVMMDFEAVNAANLDGGSSSVMVYNGEVINVCSSITGSRDQPAAFVVDALD